MLHLERLCHLGHWHIQPGTIAPQEDSNLIPGRYPNASCTLRKTISTPPSKLQQQTIDAGIAYSKSLCHTLSVRGPAIFLLKLMVGLL